MATHEHVVCLQQDTLCERRRPPHEGATSEPEREPTRDIRDLGNYFDIDPVLVRIVFVILTAAGGAGVLAYLILWIVMPRAGSTVATGGAGIGEGVRTMATELKDVGREFGSSVAGAWPPPPPPPTYPSGGVDQASASRAARGAGHRHERGVPILGLAFIVLGLWLLLANLGVIDWASARYVWPIALVGLGFVLLIRRVR
ncbi:MAG: PspC domain-containing protein [Candidatus Dormiibacterota bacterium]